MKKIVNDLIWGNNVFVSGAVAFVVVCFILGCSCGKGLDLGNIGKDSSNQAANSVKETDTKKISNSGETPSESVVEGLVKDTITEFADAVNSGDFEDMHKTASEDFQATYTASEMRTAFKSYIDKKKIVLPILKKVPATDAEFTSAPSIRNEKSLDILVAKGEFKTKPYKVRYDFEYVMREGEWKLLKLVINIP